MGSLSHHKHNMRSNPTAPSATPNILLLISEVLDTLKLTDVADLIRKRAAETAESTFNPLTKASTEEVYNALSLLQQDLSISLRPNSDTAVTSTGTDFVTTPTTTQENIGTGLHEASERDEAEKFAVPILKSLLGASTYIPRHMLRELSHKFIVRTNSSSSSSHRSSSRPTTIRPGTYRRYKAPGAATRAHQSKQPTSDNLLPSFSPNDISQQGSRGSPKLISHAPVVVTNLPKSEVYMPYPQGLPREEDSFDPLDQYRDDDDPGYRIRDLWEAELIHEIQIRERGEVEAAKIPFYPAFDRPTGTVASLELNTPSSADVHTGLNTYARGESNPAGWMRQHQGTPIPTPKSTSSATTSFNSPDPTVNRGGSFGSLSGSSKTTKRTDISDGFHLPSISNFDEENHDTTSEMLLQQSLLPASQRRTSSPTFGCEEQQQQQQLNEQQHISADVMHIPTFGVSESNDRNEGITVPPFEENNTERESHKNNLEASTSTPDICSTYTSKSPEFGGENAHNNVPVENILLSGDSLHHKHQHEDELDYCSIQEKSQQSPEQLISTQFYDSSTEKSGMSSPGQMPSSVYDSTLWKLRYSDGNFALHRSNMAKEKQNGIGNVIHPPSGDPQFPVCEDGKITDCFNLKVIYERYKTGFEEFKEFQITLGMCIAGRYIVEGQLGQAAFSKALRCYDTLTKQHVCMKVIRNDKDYVDQSLDEIKLLRYLNCNADVDMVNILRLLDFFYYKEHLVLITEILKENLYEFGRKYRERKETYFTMGRIQRIAFQVLQALAYVHSLHLVHSDLKPENILIKSAETCEVKVIDFGSSCFVDDQLSLYVQSRSYRAPEVLLGLPYDQKIDIWGLGCILAELWTGYVLFQNESVASLLARIVGIIGPLPSYMVYRGQHVSEHFTQDGQLFQVKTSEPPCPRRGKKIRILLPKPSSLRQRMRTYDEEFIDFLAQLLQIDPVKRPTAVEAFEHPWLQHGRYSDGLL